MSEFKNFKEVLAAVERQDFEFRKDIAMQIAWNAGYALGRRRWYWGPRWFVALHGWINTQIQKAKLWN